MGRPTIFALTEPGPLRLYSTRELLDMLPPQWLITPIMPQSGLVGLYGPPGVGKSFLALDMALSVAAGRLWQGHDTQPGYVLYISAEGGTGIGKRVHAWLQDHAINAHHVDTSIAWLTQPLSLYADSSEVACLMERIEHEIAKRPTLIVVDTLARCFDGDENQQQDMGRFIAGADRLRHAFGATVLVVHHTRLDGERERGNTAFRGAADTMMAVSRRNGLITLACNKQKDAEEFEPLEFRLKVVPAVESCVLNQPRSARKAQQTSDILEILTSAGSLTWNEWLASAKITGMSQRTFNRRIVALRETGQIIKTNGYYEASSC